MPSAAVRQLTAAHRRQLEQLSRTVRARVARIAAGATPADIDAWWAAVEPRVIELVQRGSQAAATLAEHYLRRHAALEGVTLDPVRGTASTSAVRDSLRITGPVGFKQHMTRSRGNEAAALRTMQDRMSASAVRHLLNGERDTIMSTFAERDEVAGWRRVGRGAACPFCLMLISRGAVYSKTTVNFEAHDNCGCTPELVYRRESEPPEVDRLREQWERITAGRSGPDALRAWRDALASA